MNSNNAVFERIEVNTLHYNPDKVRAFNNEVYQAAALWGYKRKVLRCEITSNNYHLLVIILAEKRHISRIV